MDQRDFRAGRELALLACLDDIERKVSTGWWRASAPRPRSRCRTRRPRASATGRRAGGTTTSATRQSRTT